METDGRPSHDGRLHILYLPLMAPGHMVPMLDIVKLFSRRGVRCTVVTTPGNAATVNSAIKNTSGIDLRLIPLPSSLIDSQGRENISAFSSRADQVAFLYSLRDLRPSFEAVLQDLCPNAVVADRSFLWATDLCAGFGIPRLVFHGTSAFASCALMNVFQGKFHEEYLDGDEEVGKVVIDGLPHRIELLKSQVPNPAAMPPQQAVLIDEAKVSEEGSYGVIVNSFHELEPDYVRHYREVLGRKTWHVGPVSLCNNETDDIAVRGAAEWATPTARRCQEWLDTKPPSSVIYICFGSLVPTSAAQLKEMSLALASAHLPFIWVVRDDADRDGMEAVQRKEAEGECLVVCGWAPQVLILNHASVGGFVTHCGWNSSLESISAGVPMVTWPHFADQFLNEKLIVDVLEVGVPIGSKQYAVEYESSVIAASNIKAAVNRLMGNGDEAEARRGRAKELAAVARRAVMEGGSSYEDMSSLIEELGVTSEWRTVEWVNEHGGVHSISDLIR